MEKIKNEKLFMKIICVSLAVILWFYVSYYENPTMTKTVRDVNVSISDEQLSRLNEKGLSIYSISTEYVDVKVSARRLNLIKATNKTLSAYINISAINKVGTYSLPAIVTSDENFGASFFVKGEDIRVIVEPIVSKEFAVTPDVTHTQISYDKSTLSNDRVMVTAPQSILKEIGSIKTEHITVEKRIDSEKSKFIVYDTDGKKIDNKLIKIHPEEVEISFSYLEEKIVPITIITANEKVFRLPSIYDIKIYGHDETINNISTIETEAIDISSYEVDDVVKLKLEIPDKVKTEDDNQEVEVILQPHYFE